MCLNIPIVVKAAPNCTAYAPRWRVKMAENNVEPEHEWSDWALDTAEDTLVAMETLLATLRAFEDVLRQQEISVVSSTEYCDNFCQVMCTCSIEATISPSLAHPGLFFFFAACKQNSPATFAGLLAKWRSLS